LSAKILAKKYPLPKAEDITLKTTNMKTFVDRAKV
jgi:hypothetical protein